jgi:hypothetical protein
MKRCIKCGFILGTRPENIDTIDVCGACLNKEKSQFFNWKEREKDLKDICEKRKAERGEYDCVIAVSGGKDSTVIVANLVEKYGMKPLLVTVTDEFSHTKAGLHNSKNIAERFNCDHIIWRCEPETFKRETLKDFEETLHPLKWIEEKLYGVPIMVAKKFGIPIVFFGENSDFQYGRSDKLDYLHKLSDEHTKIYYYFAFVPYSELGNREEAKKYGFIDLDDTGEWFRQGHIENYTQQDSVAYVIQLWTKFVKFGFQRVSDIACRYVRDGKLTREQAISYIEERDWQCDPYAKRDFCQTIGITEKYFDEVVSKHANKDLVCQDANGQWKLK